MTIKRSKDHYRTTKSGQMVLVHGHNYEASDEDFGKEFEALFPGEPAPAPQPVETQHDEPSPKEPTTKPKVKLDYKASVHSNLEHMGTPHHEWKATPIKKMVSIEGPGGKTKLVPEFDHPAGYSEAPTMFPGNSMASCCQLCGTPIQNIWHLQNDEKKWTLKVGSECVTHFEEGKTGEKLGKEFITKSNLDFYQQTLAIAEKLKDAFVTDATKAIIQKYSKPGKPTMQPTGSHSWKNMEAHKLWKKIHSLTHTGKGDLFAPAASAMGAWVKNYGDQAAGLTRLAEGLLGNLQPPKPSREPKSATETEEPTTTPAPAPATSPAVEEPKPSPESSDSDYTSEFDSLFNGDSDAPAPATNPLADLQDGAKLVYPGGYSVTKTGGKLVYQGPYNHAIKTEVSHLPGKKWNGLTKAWMIPTDQAAALHAVLAKHAGEPIDTEPVATAEAKPAEAPAPVASDTVAEPGPKVGDTKVEDGKTYVLNANHRWELAPGQEEEPAQAQAAAPDPIEAYVDALKDGWHKPLPNGVVISITSMGGVRLYKKTAEGKPLPAALKAAIVEIENGQGFKKKQQYHYITKANIVALAKVMADFDAAPKGKKKAPAKPKPTTPPPGAVTLSSAPGSINSWKLLEGPKGSNPGGLYQDLAGKKWYVKFPPTEDHAKNELLAAKLYRFAGIPGPKLRLVNKDGKAGIASEWQEGLSIVHDGGLLATKEGAKEGFGMDAWLANWDVAGLSMDNMPMDAQGKAVRIDVGGSLLYRAQGTPKGSAFGDSVTEVDTLRDPIKNPQTASIFKSMSGKEIMESVAKVLEIDDETIQKACEKWGPGTEEDKKALAAKLITRKQDLAKRFPEADKIANPPKPDPAKLPVQPEDFPNAPDFFHWPEKNGEPLSSKPELNSQNQALADQIYAVATSGNLTALLAMTHVPVGQTEPVPMSKAGSKHIRAMYEQCVSTLSEIAIKGKKQKIFDFNEEVNSESLEELCSSIQSFPYGVTKHNAPAGKRLGFWLSLADAPGAEALAPKNEHYATLSDKAKGSASISGMPQILKTFMANVKSGGSANDPYREGKEYDHAGNKCRDVTAAAYQHAVEFSEGTIITKHIDFEDNMVQGFLGKQPGHIFQNPGSMCTSLKPNWDWSGQVKMEMVYAKGAKGLYNIGVGSYNHEGEITTLPGQRYLLLEFKQKPGKHYLKVLVLPPDPTYVSNLKRGVAA